MTAAHAPLGHLLPELADANAAFIAARDHVIEPMRIAATTTRPEVDEHTARLRQCTVTPDPFDEQRRFERAHHLLTALFMAAGIGNGFGDTITTDDVVDWVRDPKTHAPRIRALLQAAPSHWIDMAELFITNEDDDDRAALTDVILTGILGPPEPPRGLAAVAAHIRGRWTR